MLRIRRVARHRDHGIVVVAGRLFALLGVAPGALPLGDAVWGGTAIDARIVPAGTMVRDVITGATFEGGGRWPLARLFAEFPGAALAW